MYSMYRNLFFHYNSFFSFVSPSTLVSTDLELVRSSQYDRDTQFYVVDHQ